MSKIITITHQKGGVGKSTLALQLAYLFAGKLPTAIIDLDPQGTVNQLSAAIDEKHQLNVISADIKSLRDRGEAVIFIDTPPYNNAQLPALLEISDYVLIPTKAGVPDVLAISATIGFVKEAQRKNAALKAGIVINMIKPRSALTDSVRKQLKNYDIPVVAEIRDRVSYARTLMDGGVIKSEDSQAIDEISKLTNNILAAL